jgi:hypothetical protein
VRRVVGTLAVLSLAAHLAFLPPTLEDSDSVNFALGVRDFDVALHQPHPPGYPVFMALGKISTAAVSLVGVSSPEASGLAILSALGGAALTLLLFMFFRSFEGEDERRAVIAAVLTTCSPLVWFNSARPMSDIAGLAVAFGALAALATGLRGPRHVLTIVAGAFLAGLAVGLRSQMAILTFPFLLLVMIARRRDWPLLAGAAGAGIAVWAVPLIVLSGGPAGYLRALSGQADSDFTGVVMLWTHPTIRVAAEAVLHTFVRPWESPVLGGVMLALAGGGALVLAARGRRALAILVLTFGPYAVFHLLFQEPLTSRYALPLIPVSAYLVATILAEVTSRVALAFTVALASASLACAIPATTAFGKQPSPIFALLSEVRMLQDRGASPVVGMHRRVFTESRRARIYAGEMPGTVLPSPRDYEWLELTRAWREGHDGETWFIADPHRTDLALVDQSHSRVRQYRWPFNGAVYLGGTRPDEIDWHILNDPGWFLEQGWALTPETAGIAERDSWGPHKRPSVGWVRRRESESILMLGGRHLAGEPPVKVIASLDDRPVATLDVRPGFFLDFIKVPAGALAGEGRYAKLTVRAEGPHGAPPPPVSIEQFNLQTPDRILFGFGKGWYEPEYNPKTARSWRWMSEHAVVRVHHAGRAVTLRINGESPRHYFDQAPTVRVVAGGRVLSEIHPFADFTNEVSIPADVLDAAGGEVVIASDRAFVAGEREGTADRRRLALRIYSVVVEGRTP